MKCTRTQHVLEIVFDDLDSKNSFSLEMAQLWLKEAAAQPTHLMLLRSKGSVFCSGGNLAEYASMSSKDEGVAINAEIRKCLEEIDALPCLKVAFVDGDCFGGGIEVLSLCQRIYSRHHVFYGLWQSRMHLSFGWGGFQRLARRMTPSALQLWLSEGRTHSAYWCHEQGLVDELLAQDMFMQRYEFLKSIALGKGARYFADNVFNGESQFFESLWWSDEHRKSLARFKT